jgi:hypothetical protein
MRRYVDPTGETGYRRSCDLRPAPISTTIGSQPIFAGLTDKRLVDSAGKELVQLWRTYADPPERHNSRGEPRASIAIEKARAAIRLRIDGKRRNSSTSRCARDGHRFESRFSGRQKPSQFR